MLRGYPDRHCARGIARSVFGKLPAEMVLWQQAAEPDQFVPLDGAAIHAALFP